MKRTKMKVNHLRSFLRKRNHQRRKKSRSREEQQRLSQQLEEEAELLQLEAREIFLKILMTNQAIAVKKKIHHGNGMSIVTFAKMVEM